MKRVCTLSQIILFLFLSFVAYNQPLQDSLIAHYNLDANALDASGNGNDGIVLGAMAAPDRFGNLNSAYEFDGFDDAINIPNTFNSQIPNPNAITISAWIKPTNTKTGTIISQATSS